MLGYEELNDHDRLKVDPLLGLVAGKKDPTGEDGSCRSRDAFYFGKIIPCGRGRSDSHEGHGGHEGLETEFGKTLLGCSGLQINFVTSV